MHPAHQSSQPSRSPRVPLPAAADFCLPAEVLYLDTAAQGPRLHAVLAAGHAALEASATPWRLATPDWMARIEGLRALAARTLFEGDVEGVAMVPSAAFGLATAARNLPLQRGESVLVLEAQFPSNLLAWQVRAAETGAKVVPVSRTHAQDWTEAVLATVRDSPGIRIAALPHAHWHDGALLDLDRIAPRLQSAGIALVLDLSQSLGVLPARLAHWQPAFVVGVGHKWLLGPTGLAWLWAAPHWREQGAPIEQHWSARAPAGEWTFPVDVPPPYQAGARRFDAGGITDPLRLAMAEVALAHVAAWGPDAIATRLGKLTGALRQALESRGLGHWHAPGHAPHLTALRAPDADVLDQAHAALSAAGVVCTRRAGVLRIAPYLHVTEADMDQVAITLADAL